MQILGTRLIVFIYIFPLACKAINYVSTFFFLASKQSTCEVDNMIILLQKPLLQAEFLGGMKGGASHLATPMVRFIKGSFLGELSSASL